MHIVNIPDECQSVFGIAIKETTMKGTIENFEQLFNSASEPNDIKLKLALARKTKQKRRGFNCSVIPRCAALIAVGDYGFKQKKSDAIAKNLEALNQSLLKNNQTLFLVRNCDDDPALFNENKFNFSNINFLPDVALLVSKNLGNFLCVGGGVSYNKKWKERFKEATGNSIFFEDESTNSEAFDSLLKNDAIPKIECVVSASCPTFCNPSDDFSNGEIKKWYNDGDISDLTYFKQQRMKMDRLYMHLSEIDNTPSKWFYGLLTNSSSEECVEKRGSIEYISRKSVHLLKNNKETGQTYGDFSTYFKERAMFEPLHVNEQPEPFVVDNPFAIDAQFFDHPNVLAAEHGRPIRDEGDERVDGEEMAAILDDDIGF